MEAPAAVPAFACLGHLGRLAVFRLLLRLAPQGMRPTEIAQALGFLPDTLSHRPSDLRAARLLRLEQRGHSLLHSVDLATAEGLIGATQE